MKRLLIVEDEHNLARVVSAEARSEGWDVAHAGTGEEGLVMLEEHFDVMLLDLNLPGMSGIDLFRSISSEENLPEVVILTGNAEVNIAVEAMKMGAYDYLQKPFPMERLLLVLEKAGEKSRLKLQNLMYQKIAQRGGRDLKEPVFVEPAMAQVLEMADRVAPSDSTVVILGETGAGKDVLAHYIHRRSQRASGPIISINCASLQESMLENELFGHEKGAFTDARERKLGFFEIASGGTLFLDEISEMPFAMQAKLLHVLENNQFYRVGGTRLIRTDTRILVATNRDLERHVQEGTFRQDLYYRINMFSVTVPPLRSRPRDVLPLANHFLLHTAKTLSREAEKLLAGYQWPGNVRELKHVVERAAIIAPGEIIRPDHLMISAPVPARTAIEETGGDEHLSLQEIETAHIHRVLRSVSGNRSEAARILGIDPKTLYRKMRKLTQEEEELD